MVQKEQKRPRGRPRAYDPDRALAQAMGAFWDRGYAATSLDDISAATGMNRPSLYAAFGDKHAIYMKALRHYGAGTALRDGLSYDEPLCDALRRAYGKALAVYLSEEHGARGCFVIGTAATEAVTDPEVRGFLGELVLELDALFEARIRKAQDAGELPPDADPAALAKMATATLLSLAIRSRAGESRAELAKTAEAGIVLICGSAGAKPFSRREKVAAERPDEGLGGSQLAPMAGTAAPHLSPAATSSPSGRGRGAAAAAREPFSRREKVAAERPDEGLGGSRLAPAAGTASPHLSPPATSSPSGRGMGAAAAREPFSRREKVAAEQRDEGMRGSRLAPTASAVAPHLSPPATSSPSGRGKSAAAAREPFSQREKVAAEQPDEGLHGSRGAPTAGTVAPHLSPPATSSPSGRGTKRSIRLARGLRKRETSAEDLLWHELRSRRLDGFKFRRQAPIAGCIVDFACVDARLAIEVDGQHHAEQADADRARREKVEAAGYLEIRFTNDEVRGRLAWVIEEIRRMLDVARGRAMRDPVLRLD